MTTQTEQTAQIQNRIPTSKGKLQNRITLLLIAILIPIMMLFAWYNVTALRQNLEGLIQERAEATAISGAATIGSFIEHSIQSGDLTREEAFDTNYQQYWQFDPTTFPDFEGDPASLAKYHTAYDAYTDEHWQDLIDPFLGGEDLIFAVPVDVNGYLPTHNTRWSSWDGSPATDRSKRIFDDPVGIKAAQNTEPILQQIYERPGTGETLWDVSAPIYVDGEHWGAFRVGIELSQNQERIIAATWQTIFGLSIVIILIAIFSLIIGRYISAPIVKLTDFATQVAAGDLSQQINIQNRQEITTLAQAFNFMTFQVRDLVGNLENRVSARTEDLNLAADIGRQISQAREIDEVLNEAVSAIRDQFNLYQVQIYLADKNNENLVLRASDGFAGSRLLEIGHQLPIDEQSINGSAAHQKQAVIVANTQESASFRPHPLLPDTRSEMAVPLLVEDNVLGVIDLQSSEADSLTSDVLPAFTVLAGQLAIAIINARQNRDLQNNQRLMRDIIDSTLDWVIVKSRENRFILANEAFSNYIGVPVEDMIGKDDIEIGFDEELVKGNPEKGIPGFWPEDQQVMNSGEVFQKDDKLVDFDQVRYNSTVKTPLKDEDGNVIGMLAFVHDITNLKLAEETVAKRAEELQAVAELSTAVSSLADPQQLLQAVVDLTKERFDFYHAHVYLMDESGENLILTAGAGEIGKTMVDQGRSIPLSKEQSLVARSARTKEGIIVNDVFADPGFLPNPLLPNTKSEMAIPIIVGQEVLGVLDVQADSKERFSDQDIQIQMTLASQTAVALQNANQIQQTRIALQEASTFRRLVEGTRQSVGIADAQGTVYYTNQALAHMVGQKANEMVGDPMFSLYPSDIQLRFQEEIIPTVLEKGQWEGELRIFGANGEEIPTFENYFILPDEHGNPAQIAAIISDISERKQTEETIRANQALMRTIIDATPDWIFVKNREHRYQLVNKAYADSFHQTPEEFIGKDDIELGFPEDVVKGNSEKGIRGFWPDDDEIMASKQMKVIPEEPAEVDGQPVVLRTIKAPLIDTEGNATGIVGFVQDITSQKEAQEAQIKLAQELEEQLNQVNALQRAMTREGWQAFLTNKEREATGFAFSADQPLRIFDENSMADALGNLPYDINEVEEISFNPTQTAVTMPLQVHGESIGVIGARTANGEPLNAEQQALLTTLTTQVAESLDRVRLFEETEIARSQTEALFTGSENVVRSTSLKEILAALVEATALKNMERATLLFFNRAWQDTPPESSTIAATWQNKGIDLLADVGTTYSHDTYPLFNFLQKDAPFVIEDFNTFPNLDDNSRRMFIEGLGLQTAITIPLVVGDQWIGFVLGLSSETASLNEGELRQISGLAGQAATVAQSLRLYQDAQSRAEREQILRQVSDRVYAAPDAETVLRTAAREIGQALGLETFIYLEDEITEEENLPTTG